MKVEKQDLGRVEEVRAQKIPDENMAGRGETKWHW